MKRKRTFPKSKLLLLAICEKAQTPAEDLLWQLLRDRRSIPVRFRRQQPVGPYIADFYCHEIHLIIECDGEPHTTVEGIAYDRARDEYLNRMGFTVIRFENRIVEMDAQNAIQTIRCAIEDKLGLLAVQPSPPAPLPKGEGSN